jgi:sporulation protein YlmC with PRC-barrel domain
MIENLESTDEFEMANVNGYDVIKTKDGKYVGLVTEDKIIASESKHSSLTSLIESLAIDCHIFKRT